MKRNNKNWLQKMPRKKLNEYILQCDKLHSRAIFEGNSQNEEIYALWLAEATMEVKRRDKLKEFYTEHIIKKKDSRF